jgi:hypothetical protein
MRATLTNVMRSGVFAGLLAFTLVERAGAQLTDSSGAYDRCALNIVPGLFALDVVRGAQEAPVASLAFLVPKRVVRAFAGSEPAEQHATHAFRLRRTAAVLTDLGLIVVVAAGSRAAVTAHNRSTTATISGIGLAMVASSVPIHFAADRELSRAVWEYNRRFGR